MLSFTRALLVVISVVFALSRMAGGDKVLVSLITCFTSVCNSVQNVNSLFFLPIL